MGVGARGLARDDSVPHLGAHHNAIHRVERVTLAVQLRPRHERLVEGHQAAMMSWPARKPWSISNSMPSMDREVSRRTRRRSRW